MIFALPTDTCYGIAGDLSSHDIDHIYRLKHRSKDKQLALLVRDIDMLREYAELS